MEVKNVYEFYVSLYLYVGRKMIIDI